MNDAEINRHYSRGYQAGKKYAERQSALSDASRLRDLRNQALIAVLPGVIQSAWDCRSGKDHRTSAQSKVNSAVAFVDELMKHIK